MKPIQDRASYFSGRPNGVYTPSRRNEAWRTTRQQSNCNLARQTSRHQSVIADKPGLTAVAAGRAAPADTAPEVAEAAAGDRHWPFPLQVPIRWPRNQYKAGLILLADGLDNHELSSTPTLPFR